MESSENQVKIQIISLFKGADDSLVKSLPPSKINELAAVTVKELMILAESTQSGGSSQILKIYASRKNKLTQKQISDLNCLIEFGSLSAQLPEKTRKEAEKKELMQELNHFSRIMGLDKVISGSDIHPLPADTALSQTKDFSRFLWLVFERRNQRLGEVYNLYGFPGKVSVKTDGRTCVFSLNKVNNFSAVLFSEEVLQTAEKSEFMRICDVFAEMLGQNCPDIAVFMLDYFLFLINTGLKLSLISSQQTKISEPEAAFRLTATGGSAFVMQTDLSDFSNKVLQKYTFSGNSNYLGSPGPVFFRKENFTIGSRASQIFLFDSKVKFNELNRQEIQNLINRPDKKGKINPVNNINNLLQKTGTGSVFTVLKPDNRVINLNNKNYQPLIPEKLLAAKKIVIESAHLHADRSPSATQTDTVVLRDSLVNGLKQKGFKGIFENILMIDDYHVVNRLDYGEYMKLLENEGFIPDYVVLESSPLIRAVAEDLLKKLLTDFSGRVKLRSGNLYLELTNSRVIELVEGFGSQDVLGCVLFDAAFSLFKKDIKTAVSLFTGINDQEILSFYLKESDPILRKNFITRAVKPLPGLAEMRKNSETPFLNLLLKTEGVEIVNVHEIFYQPQQAKVNAVLQMINTNPITTAYINPQANNVLIECSALFG